MARGKGFFSKLGQLADKLDLFAGAAFNEPLARAADKIVADLQREGPDWTGDFKNNWVVALGDVEIPATVPRRKVIPNAPLGTATEKIKAPPIPGKKSFQKIRYTIGNRTQYRAIAMDLDPEQARTSPRANGTQPNNTADKDWFETYLNAGQIDKAIASSLGPELDRAWRKT